jgi:hypothetical protein
LTGSIVKVCGLVALVAAFVSPSAANAAWRQPASESSPINQAPDGDAGVSSLAVVGGVPYVAWTENDGTNREVRVARYDDATNKWVEPWTGVSDSYGGVNESSTRNAAAASLASVGGVPYVAWIEDDGTNQEVRVARLNSGTSTWSQPWTGVSATSGGINGSTTGDGQEPRLAAVGSTPYVAWKEFDGTNTEVRVARLNGLTPSWEQPWTGVSATYGGIN